MAAKKGKRGAYAVTAESTRAELVRMVTVENLTVTAATRALGMKFNTGKVIIDRYRETGHVRDRRYKANKRDNLTAKDTPGKIKKQKKEVLQTK